ncbi:MAG TPA: hypothetical protein PK674_00480 [Candidatus Absconditabacterales bacterium]|nr:hypothetical protein [Candidatus Absconditabacterales bacterium]HOQ78622.1 hypothetical protein [Candidatus Absconditabacterales bacterium]HPK27801.1 hypothetical protein [Candidatus Absconditabacterales bacterium]
MSITKAGTSTTTANENKELSLDIFEGVENTTENRKNFLEISSDELKSLQAKAISDQNYEVAAIIRDVLKEKDSHEQESKNAEFKEELNKAKEEDREQNEKQIANLKQQLMSGNIDEETLKKTLNELIRSFEENEKRNREANSKLLEDIKNAKNSGNEQELKRLRGIIKNLALEKKALKDKFAGELPKYDSAEIAKLKTKRVGFKLAGKMKLDGQTVLTGPQLLLRRNIRSRNRINKTVKNLNSIGNDPKKGVNYIMTKASLSEGGRIGSWYKNMKNFFTIRDTNTFDKIFNEHKKKFIDDLESKMDLNSMSDADKKTIAAIKARLDYYQKAYKRQFIVV